MPADAKVQTQAEADEKMVDLPSEGQSVDVEIKESPTVVSSDDDKTIDVGEKEAAPAASDEIYCITPFEATNITTPLEMSCFSRNQLWLPRIINILRDAWK